MTEPYPITPVSPTPTYTTSFPCSSTTATTSIPAAPWRNTPPFQRHHQLCTDLEYKHTSEKPHDLHSRTPHQTLPDAPRIPLVSSQIIPYCLSDLDTPSLNKLGRKLWWVAPELMVKSLSEQMVLERQICVTEDPSMHCIWAENIVFFKPIPRYLGSFAFWEYVLDSSPHCISGSGSDDREKLLATALGFLGTYARLIQRRSDFNIALRHGLLASFTRKDGYEDGRIAAQLSFEDFSLFIASFDALPSCTISTRWRFGELVLGPLNFHSVLYLRRWHLNRYEGRYAAYFQRFFPVVLFMFALFSVALSAMQVILGAKQLWETENKELKRTLGVFIWFATEAIAWSVAFGAVFVVWWIGISGSEAWKRHRLQKRMRKKVEGSGMP